MQFELENQVLEEAAMAFTPIIIEGGRYDFRIPVANDNSASRCVALVTTAHSTQHRKRVSHEAQASKFRVILTDCETGDEKLVWDYTRLTRAQNRAARLSNSGCQASVYDEHGTSRDRKSRK